MAWTAPRTWADPEVVDDTIMNAHIRDNLMIIGHHQFVRKTVTQSRSNTTTVADDAELLIPLGTSQTWEWELRAIHEAGAGGMDWTVAAPGGSTGAFFVTMCLGSSYNDADQAYGVVKSSAGGQDDTLLAFGVVVTSVTAGNLAFQWAQQASDAAATSVLVQSWLSARRIS